MFHKRILVTTWIVGLLATPGLWAAPGSLLLPDGDLFVVEEVSGRAASTSVALRSTIYHPSGAREVELIRATADRAYDAFPSLTLDPDSGRPALVWSRFNGVDFDLVLAIHDGERWGDPIPLVSTAADEIHALALAAPGEGIHVLWRHPGEDESFLYGLFRTSTGIAVRGPERVTPSQFSGNDFTEGGGDDPGIQPGSEDPTYSGSDSPRGGGGGGDCSSGGKCKTSESTSPVRGSAACGRVSVAVPVGDSVCILSRGKAAWSRLTCAPAGTVDLPRALEGLGSSACGP